MSRAAAATKGSASGRGRVVVHRVVVDRVLVVSGPNLDRLGKRQPDIYGNRTLASIHELVAARASALGVEVECVQSNREGELCTILGKAADEGFTGVLLNAAGYTHTSVALLDAVLASGLPTVEVHLSNPEAREAFRHVSMIARACIGKVSGFAGDSYVLALEGLVGHLRRSKSPR